MDAYRCFMGTEIDALVIGRYLLLKADQPVGNRPDHAEYLAGYRND
jgi:carbamoyltransferase